MILIAIIDANDALKNTIMIGWFTKDVRRLRSMLPSLNTHHNAACILYRRKEKKNGRISRGLSAQHRH